MDRVSKRFPITKFQKLADGRMVVEGIATDESLDSQGDILDYEGSKKAFGDWRGNVREAHDPKKPVGKALEVAFNDAEKSIPVRVFISTGAQDTQAKVEDGTLSCFSVGGGNPTKVRMEKVGDRMVRRVLEWPMSELSLVDAGANPNATFQLVKADGVATEVLAEETAPVPAPVGGVNRFADKLLKATKEMEAAKKDDAPPEHEPCDKCMKVHKDGVEACDKTDLAAAETARAKKGIDEAKAKHKVARAKEELAAAKGKLEAVKAGDEEPAGDEAEGDGKDEPDESEEDKTKKAARAAGVKKAFEEWDIRQALDILEGLKNLLFNESSEEGEPPAEKVALETAILNVKAFIASEAAELAATPAAEGIPSPIAAAAPAYFVKAMETIEARFASLEQIQKSRTPEDVPDTFTVNHGDQLAEGIGKGLSAALAPITKANVELKGLFEAELKDVRKSIEVLGKTAAVPMPLRTVPREAVTAPARAIDSEIATLEKALATATHPDTQVYLRQQIGLAKARPQG